MSPASYKKKSILDCGFISILDSIVTETNPSPPTHIKADMLNSPCVTFICPTILLQGERKEASQRGSGPESLQPISLSQLGPRFFFLIPSQFHGVEYALCMSGLRERNAVTMDSTSILAYPPFFFRLDISISQSP